MTPAFVRNLMSRASELYDVRLPETDRKRYAAEPEPMTDFGGFDRRAAPVETGFGVLDAIKTDPNVAPEFADALLEGEKPACPRCEGTGLVQDGERFTETGLRVEIFVDCPACDGSGSIGRRR